MRKALLKDERKTKEREVKEVKDKVNSTPGLIDEIEELRAEIRYKTEKIEEYEKDQSILSKLYDMGIIDENGDLVKHDQNDNMN